MCRAIISAQTAQFKSREQNRPFTSSQSSRNDKVQCVHSNIAIFHAELGPDQSESRVDDKLHKSAKLKWKKKSRDVSNVSPEVDRK